MRAICAAGIKNNYFFRKILDGLDACHDVMSFIFGYNDYANFLHFQFLNLR
uniref:Uncharacterized protein n=1 Tax=mine drainage metagenome TaxID=410659 RepID=E6PLI3_9ZZZZ